MVDWKINLEDSVIPLPPGKLVLACPCSVMAQKEFIYKIQKSDQFFQLFDSSGTKHSVGVPKIFLSFIVGLSGHELKTRFLWWCDAFGIKWHEHKIISHLVPSQDKGWQELSVEKKIALFSLVSVLRNDFTMLFLGDFHLESNQQIFILNLFKGICEATQHQLFLFWTYRIEIQGAIYLSYGKRINNAA